MRNTLFINNSEMTINPFSNIPNLNILNSMNILHDCLLPESAGE